MTQRRIIQKLSPHFLEQASTVAELLDAGYSNRRIAEQLGVSAPRVSQIRQTLPELEPYLGHPAPMERLKSHRDQLRDLRRDALRLAATVRGDLRELEEELESANIDHLLGLRTFE